MRRRAATLLFLAFLAGATLAAGAALAEGARAGETRTEAPSTIAVLCAPGDRFGLRIVAEIESLGFRAERLDPAAEPASRASLEASAREVGAIAAIRAVPSERGVEIWIADRVTGKTVLREMADGGGTPDSDAALALRAVELLRASLLEAGLPAPPPGEVPATREIREKLRVRAPDTPPAPAQRPSPALRLSLAPGALLSPGGFGAAVSIDVGLSWLPSEHAGAIAFAAIPVSAHQVERSQGTAELSVLLAGGGARFQLAPRDSPWTASADLGFSAVLLWSTGVASKGFRSSASAAVTASPFAGVGLSFALTPTFRLRADALASVLVEGVSVRFVERETATWGKPFILSSAGIEIDLFL
ncbi:hypothetical protein ACSRUE_21020 [Sorangium sp. KYC3313]|uniref:hypothetical protein n=1 Tax=Sorangium sp. KYC3313 TaxID=3449740 RepID=UPI003F8A5273